MMTSSSAIAISDCYLAFAYKTLSDVLCLPAQHDSIGYVAMRTPNQSLVLCLMSSSLFALRLI